ncbi:TRAM domain-containing protein [Neisseriaceae bacterium ESL0693]|nr:TRAM domain-containing protein [Neisseriaceae bacterium ESL0693]
MALKEVVLDNKQTAYIEDWNHAAQGVARVEGKVVFIQDALPGERVYWHQTGGKKSYAEGMIDGWQCKSQARVEPRCLYYAQCGGCNSQHIDAAAQVALKQRAWLNQMRRIAKTMPAVLLAPIYGQPWHYRERVRLAVSRDNGQIRLGFQHRRGHKVVDIDHCAVLPVAVSQALPLIKTVLNQSIDQLVESIGIHVGSEVIALSLSLPQQPDKALCQRLDKLVLQLSECGSLPWQWWYQCGREAQCHQPQTTPVLAYTLPEYQIRIPFQPQDFTQVSQTTNALMVHRAMQWLKPQKGQRIIDWFCGLGNFSLPMARLGAQVLGVEGVAAMCERARINARLNGLTQYCDFKHMNLFKITTTQLRDLPRADQWLLDPPRAGAQTLIMALCGLHDHELPRQIVYVSCDPATLARDVRQLVGRGYYYRAGGIMNLFAQTAHVESMAVFEWPH